MRRVRGSGRRGGVLLGRAGRGCVLGVAALWGLAGCTLAGAPASSGAPASDGPPVTAGAPARAASSAAPVPRVDPADPQSATGGRNAAEWVDAPYVILVSLDGFASRYVEAFRPPTLLSLVAGGVWADRGMQPVYPTETFPNHYSLATGLHPARHGLVANNFHDPGRAQSYRLSDRSTVQDGSWYAGEPIWVTAERQGMVSASFYWVGSEADVGGVRPSHWRQYDEDVTNSERVDQVLRWLSYPADARPHLITLYFGLTDDVGHEHGPDSPEIEQAVLEVDRELGRLMAGLRDLDHGDRVSVVVVSDHGMDGYTPASTAYLADAVSDMDGIRFSTAGPHANLWIDGGGARVRAVRDAVNERLEHVRAYLPDETPAALRYRDNARLGDLVLLPDSGWVVYPVADRPARVGFTHGWDSRNEAMRALFVASGPALMQGGRVRGISSVDVYPLVAEMLGLEPADDLDGSLQPWRSVLRR